MNIPLAWNKDEYLLSEFVSKFTLPQLVKVVVGYHGGDEDTALSRGEVLSVHVIREADTVISKDKHNRRVYIPKTCCQKVEVLTPGARNNYYETVEELCNASPRPKYVRVIKESKTQKLNLHKNFKLTLIGITKRKKFLECENQNGVRICLPMGLKARFVPLQDGREYFVHEVINSFKMPVLVEFIDSKCGTTSVTATTVFNSSLGALSLEQVLKEESIVCSTKDKTTDKRRVITIPKEMNITVVAAQEAVDKDKDYVNLCRALNDGVELSKVDALESENVYASRQKIREYMQLQLDNVQSVYAKLIRSKPLPSITHTSGHASCTMTLHGNETMEATGAKTSNHRYKDLTDLRSRSFHCQHLSEENLCSKVRDIEIENKNPRNNAKSEEDETTGFENELPLCQQNAIDFSCLSIDGVTELLTKYRLGNFAETFRDEEIDGRMLLVLDKKSLVDLGLNNFQANKLLILIHGWHPETSG